MDMAAVDRLAQRGIPGGGKSLSQCTPGRQNSKSKCPVVGASLEYSKTKKAHVAAAE